MTSAILLLLLAPLAGEPTTPKPEREPTIERHLGSMGTSLVVRVWADKRSAALRASEAAVAAIEQAEERLSTWNTDSELSRVQSVPVGEWSQLTPILASELRSAFAISVETDGAFDPRVGALVRAWDLRGHGRIPSGRELMNAMESSGPGTFELDPTPVSARLRRFRESAAIEEGGFGKGAGLRAALKALAGLPIERAELDLGGQIAVFAAGERRPVVRIAIAHPARREQPVLSITLGSGSLSTSGNSERGLIVDGEQVGHLIDPRTGKPAADFGSVTVWCEDPLRADALSTALFAMGPVEAMAFAGRHAGVEALVIEHLPDSKLLVRVTTGLAQGLELEDYESPIELRQFNDPAQERAH